MYIVVRLLSAVPVLGWFLQDAMSGPDSNKIFFFSNLVMAFLLAVYFIGYPAVIVSALIAVTFMFGVLFDITVRDFASKS